MSSIRNLLLSGKPVKLCQNIPKKEINYLSIFLAFFTGLLLPFVFSVVFAWVAPTNLPSSNNTPAPLNSSSNPQEKSGTLILGTGNPPIALTLAKKPIDKAQESGYLIKNLSTDFANKDNSEVITVKEARDYLLTPVLRCRIDDHDYYNRKGADEGDCLTGYTLFGGGCHFETDFWSKWNFGPELRLNRWYECDSYDNGVRNRAQAVCCK